jgi:hypothetical protein
MARTVVLRILGAFLLVYGVGAIVMGWWAYSVTHEAFANVRSFTSLLDQERSKATQALKGVGDLIGMRDSSQAAVNPGPAGSPSVPGAPQIIQRGEGLRDRLRGIFGGGQSSQPSTQSGSGSSSPPTGQAADSLGILDRIEQQLGQAASGWTTLGEGPFKKGMLDQVEFAVNAVLLWMAAHGLASIIVGMVLLIWSPRPAPQPAMAYPTSWGPPYSPPPHLASGPIGQPQQPGYAPGPTPPYPPAPRAGRRPDDTLPGDQTRPGW